MDMFTWTVVAILLMAFGLALFLWATFAPFARCEISVRTDPMERRTTRE